MAMAAVCLNLRPIAERWFAIDHGCGSSCGRGGSSSASCHQQPCKNAAQQHASPCARKEDGAFRAVPIAFATVHRHRPRSPSGLFRCPAPIQHADLFEPGDAQAPSPRALPYDSKTFITSCGCGKGGRRGRRRPPELPRKPRTHLPFALVRTRCGGALVAQNDDGCLVRASAVSCSSLRMNRLLLQR